MWCGKSKQTSGYDALWVLYRDRAYICSRVGIDFSSSFAYWRRDASRVLTWTSNHALNTDTMASASSSDTSEASSSGIAPASRSYCFMIRSFLGLCQYHFILAVAHDGIEDKIELFLGLFLGLGLTRLLHLLGI